MFNWDNVELLELVECYAESEVLCGNVVICDEAELSKRFDDEFEEFLAEHRDDEPMINETFNNWTDGLCKDGLLHPEQYDKYGYVGKYET
jgi:hypothetical protein